MYSIHLTLFTVDSKFSKIRLVVKALHELALTYFSLFIPPGQAFTNPLKALIFPVFKTHHQSLSSPPQLNMQACSSLTSAASAMLPHDPSLAVAVERPGAYSM